MSTPPTQLLLRWWRSISGRAVPRLRAPPCVYLRDSKVPREVGVPGRGAVRPNFGRTDRLSPGFKFTSVSWHPKPRKNTKMNENGFPPKPRKPRNSFFGTNVPFFRNHEKTRKPRNTTKNCLHFNSALAHVFAHLVSLLLW